MGMAQVMDNNFKRTTEFQKGLACKNRQLNLAQNIATGKDRFLYYSTFVGLAIPVLLIKFIKTKEYALLLPVCIFGFSWAYQYDLFYGNKMKRIRKEVKRLIEEEPEKFYPPENNLLWENDDVEKFYPKKKH